MTLLWLAAVAALVPCAQHLRLRLDRRRLLDLLARRINAPVAWVDCIHDVTRDAQPEKQAQYAHALVSWHDSDRRHR